jgi:ribosomal protein L24E
MASLIVALIGASLALVGPGATPASAGLGGEANIALFDSDIYVDADQESDNIEASLTAQGHTVTTFTGTTATEFSNALAGQDVLVIPEQDNNGLADGSAPDLSDAVLDVIRDFVEGGGTLVVSGASSPASSTFLNALFDYSLVEASITGDGPYAKTDAASGTEFEDEADSLPGNSDVSGFTLGSLPDNATRIYENATHSAVTVFSEGIGSVVFLGWDWLGSDPPNDGGEDGGWQSVLDAAVETTVATVEDATIAEGDRGTTPIVTVTVSLSGPVSETVSVQYDTFDGTATAGWDYTTQSGELTFAPGETEMTFTIPIVSDGVDEGPETFTVELTPLQPGVRGVAGEVTITDEDGPGYWFVASDGGVFSFTGAETSAAEAKFFGSTGAITLNKPIVGMAALPNLNGYWLVASDGGIFSFGDAQFYGSTGAITLNQPIVGMAATPTGLGYWFVAADGGIFSFGDAQFYGSTGAITLNKPIVGMAATPSGNGYWFVASDGGIFSFGDAQFYGSTGAVVLNKPIVGMAATPTGLGYWFVGSDGGIFSFGDAPFLGSTGAITLNKPIVGMTAAV